MAVVKAQHFEAGDDFIEELDEQLHTCLMALTDQESFDIVTAANGGRAMFKNGGLASIL